MKTIVFLVSVCCIGFISDVAAKPGSGGGGAGHDKAASQSTAVFANGLPQQNANAGSNFVTHAQEKMVQIPDVHFTAEASGKSVKSEVARKSDTGVTQTSSATSVKVAAPAPSNSVTGGAIFAPINPVAGTIISANTLSAPHTMTPQHGSTGSRFEKSMLDTGLDQVTPSTPTGTVAAPAANNSVTGAALFAPIDPVAGTIISATTLSTPNTMAPQQGSTGLGLEPVSIIPLSSGTNPVPAASVSLVPNG